MPITQTIDPLARLVLGIGSGELTLTELATFSRDALRAGLMHYSKLIDVTDCTPGFTSAELAVLATVLRENRTDTPRGPLAIVADPHRGEFARLFTGFEIDGRPAQVFSSIHDARRWLREQSAPEVARKPGRRL